MPSPQILDHRARLNFLQDADDLLFSKPLPFRLPDPLTGQTLAPTGERNMGHVGCNPMHGHAATRPSEGSAPDATNFASAAPGSGLLIRYP